MKFRLVIVLLALLAVLSSCGESKGWTEALNETSPPNPDENRGVPASERARTRQGQPIQNQAVTENQTRNSPEKQTSSATGSATSSAGTTLLLTLNTFPNCHVGAVRLYVNRKFVDIFNDQGTLVVTVNPGLLDVEILDSGGSWKFQVNAQAGVQNEVSVDCGEKAGFDSQS